MVTAKLKAMRKIYLVILILLVSCGHIGERHPAQASNTNVYKVKDSLRVEIEQFQELVEEALVWRSKALDFSERNKEKFKKQNLSHAEMLLLYASTKDYLALRDKILELAHRYERAAEASAVVEYVPGAGTTLDQNLLR
ncbi:MAG: hypothetical protein EHM20_06940, partial [Alphaproteobacteria bacterium]